MPPKRVRTETISAKKRARIELDRARSKGRIYLGDQYDRWTDLKDQLTVSHAVVAKLLLDSYENAEREKALSAAACTSTPHTKGKPLKLQPDNVASSMSGSETVTALSSICELPSSPQGPGVALTTCPSDFDKSSSDSDPFGVAAATRLETSYKPEYDEDEDIMSDSDSSYEYISEDEHADESVTLGLDDSTFDVYDDGEDDEDVDEVTGDTGIPQLQTPDDGMGTCGIVYTSMLLELIKLIPDGRCLEYGCQESYVVHPKQLGTSLHLSWICGNGHQGHEWSSQPRVRVRGMRLGDFMVCSNTILSGNNFHKIGLFLQFMKMGKVMPRTFYAIQKLYCCPTIDTEWQKVLSATHDRLREKELVICGDGRNDSPGHSANYLTYTFMECDTADIVQMVFVDKRETGLKSPNMEAFGYQKGLDELLEKSMNVKAVVTDGHVQIASIMKKKYKQISHDLDVWHGAKNFGKKIATASSEKKLKDLGPWKRSIVNHFWHCSEKANGSPLVFRSLWRGMLHHVVNKHEWALGDGGGPAKCEHGDLGDREDKEWLVPDSPAHQRLRQLMLDTRFMNNIPRYVNFRHTGNLEVFHNHILMYAAKRFAFRYPGYKARNQLAALDYQAHKDRAPKINKKGEQSYGKSFSKKTSRWVVTPLKMAKTYPHIPAIQKSILSACMTDHLSMYRKIALGEDDPRRIAPNIAPFQPSMSTSEMASQHKSRFTKSTVTFAMPSTSRAVDTEEELMPASSEGETLPALSNSESTE